MDKEELVLRLPEMPEGTVALTGVAAPHRRYEPRSVDDEDDPVWRRADDGALFEGVGAVLDAEHHGTNKGVRVELAPASPEQRTAAEIWAGLTETQRAYIGAAPGAFDFAEALDREAGFSL